MTSVDGLGVGSAFAAAHMDYKVQAMAYRRQRLILLSGRLKMLLLPLNLLWLPAKQTTLLLTQLLALPV